MNTGWRRQGLGGGEPGLAGKVFMDGPPAMTIHDKFNILMGCSAWPRGTPACPPRSNHMHPPTPPTPDADDPEILDTGQEEVFSRTEVERGEIEHASEAGAHHPPAPPPARPPAATTNRPPPSASSPPRPPTPPK